MPEAREQNSLGVLGGMGGLASAEFLKTIYECAGADREQESPVVMVLSDPTFPDRTEAFLRGDVDVLYARLLQSLHRLGEMGASKFVICCMTMHYLLPRLPLELRRRVVSLVDIIFANVEQDHQKYLLLCSTGTQKLRLFQSQPQWKRMEENIVFPDEKDQAYLHGLIYQVKQSRCIQETLSFLETRRHKYRVDAFVAGCTEMHILAKHSRIANDNRSRFDWIDPLTIIARMIADKSL